MKKKFSICLLILVFAACHKNQSKPFSHWKEPVTGMEFVLIPQGSFYMGNPFSNPEDLKSDTQHLVTLTHDFWLARTEVTLKQWRKVMGDFELHPEKPNPFSKDNPQYPVVSISYNDVEQFLQKMEELSPGNRFRLPTEAEWEYACRAGTSSNYFTGSHISDSEANFSAEYPSAFSPIGKDVGHPTPVGSYSPNPWGLYDMHGNVWEWVSDWYAPYSSDQAFDPKGPQDGTEKVIRGGSWYFGADSARSFFRGTHSPQLWGFSIGFRIVCEKEVAK